MKVKYEKRVVDFYCRDDDNGRIGLHCGAHLHYHIEIAYMISGKSRALVDSEAYDVEAGDMLVIFPNKIHRFTDIEKHPRYKLFIINPNLVPEFESDLAVRSPKSALIKNARGNKRLDALISILAEYKDFPSRYREDLMRGYLLSFFGEIMSMMELDLSRSEENQSMKSLVLYCSKNFTRELSLSVLEKELHLSKYYISHIFSDKLGVGFIEYINSLRISEACRLLRTTDYSITEVADASGFGTLRTFNRAFIKQIGMSPSNYRKNNDGQSVSVSIPPSSAILSNDTAKP